MAGSVVSDDTASCCISTSSSALRSTAAKLLPCSPAELRSRSSLHVPFQDDRLLAFLRLCSCCNVRAPPEFRRGRIHCPVQVQRGGMLPRNRSRQCFARACTLHRLVGRRDDNGERPTKSCARKTPPPSALCFVHTASLWNSPFDQMAKRSEHIHIIRTILLAGRRFTPTFVRRDEPGYVLIYVVVLPSFTINDLLLRRSCIHVEQFTKTMMWAL